VPGIGNATGVVGPPLTQFALRVYVAGMVRNTPDNLMDWLMDPQAIVPGNAMPNLDVTTRDARDMAAYLYALD
jgi:cytochrome c1